MSKSLQSKGNIYMQSILHWVPRVCLALDQHRQIGMRKIRIDTCVQVLRLVIYDTEGREASYRRWHLFEEQSKRLPSG